MRRQARACCLWPQQAMITATMTSPRTGPPISPQTVPSLLQHWIKVTTSGAYGISGVSQKWLLLVGEGLPVSVVRSPVTPCVISISQEMHNHPEITDGLACSSFSGDAMDPSNCKLQVPCVLHGFTRTRSHDPMQRPMHGTWSQVSCSGVGAAATMATRAWMWRRLAMTSGPPI